MPLGFIGAVDDGRRGQKIIRENARRIYADFPSAAASAKIPRGPEKDGQKVTIFSTGRVNIAAGGGIFRQVLEGRKILRGHLRRFSLIIC